MKDKEPPHSIFGAIPKKKEPSKGLFGGSKANQPKFKKK